MVKPKDMSGFKNDNITVIEFYGSAKGRRAQWLCLCKCGKEIFRNRYEILRGLPKSCGCYQKTHPELNKGNRVNHIQTTKHGLANKHPLYRTWKNIKQRCYNPKNKNYHVYGGKGIIICDEWKHDSGAFIHWCLANGWQKGLSIDRISSSKNYSPDNCQFLTMSDNIKKVWIENPTLHRGENHRDATITEEQARQIKIRLLRGDSQASIIRELGVSRNIVWQIAHNKTWKTIKIE